jgi:hypothetical protein
MKVLLILNAELVEIQVLELAMHNVVYSQIKSAEFIKEFIKPKRAHSTHSRKINAFLTLSYLPNM